MKRITLSLFLLLLLLAGPSVFAAPPAEIGKGVEIPFKKFVLKNGLTVIVSEDHKAPIVAVDVWYHVGSKNEKPGKTGFAHLFEHLMFNGSEHFNDDWFKALEKVGATGLNGTTSQDRTNYFEVVPKEALDFTLWLESDRMGHLLGAIDQAKLDEQRGVVQNEKRQRENQPYGRADELITKAVYPAGHPYSWTVIGSMADLNAASLDDVRNWFKEYYGAANATLVIAGDVDAEAAREKAEKYFGDIPSGPPVSRIESWVAKRTGSKREEMQDRVPQARLYKVWNTPAYRAPDSTSLGLVADVLASGKTSRLYKRLVYDDQIASDVSAFNATSEIGSLFYIVATARPGHQLGELEKAIDEELARFIAEGPTDKEMQRVKTENLAGFVRGIERIGGWGGKADTLAESEVFGGSPDFYKTALDRLRAAKPADVRGSAREWLSDGAYALEVHPFAEYETEKSTVDRSKLPVPELKPEAKFPELQRASLPNGLKIVLAERHGVPLVNFQLVVNAGFAADKPDARGVARLATDMLDEGTKNRTSLEISDDVAMLGAALGVSSDLDTTSVSVSALKANLDPTLDLFADIALNPAFPEADFNRLRKRQIDAIAQEKASPSGAAGRVFPGLVYGADHPYGGAWSGLGDARVVGGLTAADARAFHSTWFKPNNATLIVAGDTTLDEIRPKIEKLFGGWQPGAVPEKPVASVEPPPHADIYIIDRPGSIQSTILAGNVAPPKANPDEIAIDTMNDILGGSFTSRINMNLREDKHWSYGAHTGIRDARGPRTFVVSTSVQTDKTKESVIEIAKELRDILGPRPITAEELAKAQKNETLSLPGSWETIGRVTGSIAEIVRFGLPDDYYATLADKVRALTVPKVNGVVPEVVHPGHLTWVIVGDRAKIEAGLREASIGQVRVIDADAREAAGAAAPAAAAAAAPSASATAGAGPGAGADKGK